VHLGRVLGTVVATVKTPVFGGHRLLVVAPHTWDMEPDGQPFVAVDLVSAGRGEWVYYVKGREAANALADKFNPADRAILGIVDAVTLEQLQPGPLPGGGGA
jgi:ethanolamine utilization protein EutN